MLNRFAERCVVAVLVALVAFPVQATPRATPAIRIALSGRPLFSGSLDKPLIRRVIKAHRNGRVTLPFQVDRSGRVTALLVSGPPNFSDAELAALSSP